MKTLAKTRPRIDSIEIFEEGRRSGNGGFGSPIVAEQVVSTESPCDDRQETEPRDGIAPGIAGVSETMLWSLYNRASEARRADGILVDPESVQIQSAIDYDFASHFGDPQGSLAARAAEIDRALRSWIERHPQGIVVSLGEGLETQARRVDNGRMRWLSVDLPDAIRLRERFIAPTDRFRHMAVSALDPVWMDAVDPSFGVFIVAQGLLMYLPPERVRALFVSIADRFPGAQLVFDAIPRWFSDLTLRGLQQTPRYRLPSMPWGINRDEIEPTLRRWHANVVAVTFLSYRSPRGLPHVFAGITNRIPVARHAVPSLVHVTLATPDQPSVKLDVTSEVASAFGGDKGILPAMHAMAPSLPSPHGNHPLYCNPVALAEAQGRFACAWFGRVASIWIATFEAQSAAMAPLRQTVADTAEQLVL